MRLAQSLTAREPGGQFNLREIPRAGGDMAKKKRLSAKELNRTLSVSIGGELVQSYLRRLEELKDDAEFFQACREFMKRKNSGEQTRQPSRSPGARILDTVLK